MSDVNFRIVVQMETAGLVSGAEKVRTGLRNIKSEAASATSTLKTMAAAFGGAALIRELGGVANSYQEIRNRIKLVADDADATYKKLLGIALKTHTDLTSVAQAYQRIRLATEEYGYSANNVARFVENFSKLVATSGRNSLEARQAMIQLSQALGTGVLRGQDLRSVFEEMPAVLQLVAKHMGVSTGRIKELGKEGKITTSIIMESIAGFEGTKKATEDFSQIVPTLSQRIQDLKTSFTDWFGHFAEDSGLVKTLGEMLGGLADHMDAIGKAVISLAEIIGGAIFLTALKRAGEALLAFDTLAATNPFGAMLTSLVVLVPLLTQFGDEAEGAINKVLNAIPGHPFGDTSDVGVGGAPPAQLTPTQADEVDRLAKLGFFPVSSSAVDAFSGQRNPNLIGPQAGNVGGRSRPDLNFNYTNDPWDPKRLVLVDGTLKSVADQADNSVEALQGLSDQLGVFIDQVNLKQSGARADALNHGKPDTKSYRAPFDPDRGGPSPMGQGGAVIGRRDFDDVLHSLALVDDLDHTIFMGTMDMVKATERWAAADKKAADEAAKHRKELEEKNKKLALQNDGILRGFNAIAKIAKDTAGDIEKAFVDTFNTLNQELVNFVVKGEFSLKHLVDSLLTGLTTILLHAGESSLGKALHLPGFAWGGGFTVGGSGGTDSQLVMFRATPGEHVHVSQGGGRGGYPEYGAQKEGGYPEYGGRGGTVVLNTWEAGTMVSAVQTRRGRRAVRNSIEQDGQSLSAVLRSAGGRR